jgi:transcriptional regulator with GAF, ATPase, and Fis domain
MKNAEERPSSATLEIAVPSRSHEWTIELQDDRGARRIPLAGRRIVVGTGGGADLIVSDPTVSAKHCALSVLGSGIVIEDLGSTNGTFVGSARVKEAWGEAGTTATIGRSTLVFWPVARDDLGEPGPPLAGVAGGSLVMRRLATQVRRLARHSEPVLICGESGTGKELIARALHAEGPRAKMPFVVVNVAALPLVESELFGHERGAFTGAVAKKSGAFQDAEGGTLFLDEIGELPLEAQPKLLRALEYEVRRVGESGSGRRADVRVIAATLVVLEERVTQHRFRIDLFHRLEAFVVDLPPLRARRGDIGAIAKMMLMKMSRTFGPRALAPGALARLTTHDWPGNVRELANVLLRACDLTTDIIDADDIDRALRIRRSNPPPALTPSLARVILDEHGGNLSAAARAAELPRTTFRKILESRRAGY